MTTVGIIGAGAWGTALGMAAQRAGCTVVLQAHEPEVALEINARHTNSSFLPDVVLDPAIRAVEDPAAAAGCDIVLMAVPAQFVRATCARLAGAWTAGRPLVICAKGIEASSGALMTDVVADTLPGAATAVLSGPTFAAEVARDLPTALTVAAVDPSLAQRLADTLGTARFRIYRSDDMIGAQIGGAVKNVLAIACGIIEGKRLGDNSRAALITRGIAEIGRLSLARGGRMETVMGLTGLGDLVLTCTALQSRNFSLGVALGQGQSLQAVLGARRSVAEGVASAGAIVRLAARLGVDMPLSAAVDAVVNHAADIDATIVALLARPPGAETGLRQL